jgi:hypothetical protein
MKRIAVATTLILLALPAQANFVQNYGGWSTMSKQEQAAFVAGAFDGFVSPQDEPDDLAYSYGLVACATATGLTPNILAEAVSKFYSNNTGSWDVPALTVLSHVIRGTCLSYINSERATYSLPAWE